MSTSSRLPIRIRRPTPGFCLLVLIALGIGFRLSTEGGKPAPLYPRYSVDVAFVIDGDTFETADGARVRLLGIDSPEVAHHDKPGEPWGEESAKWLKEQIENRTVILEESTVQKDRYGRLLGWIYLQDGTLINERCLAEGHAELLDRFGLPAAYEARLRAAASKGKSQQRGMWKKD